MQNVSYFEFLHNALDAKNFFDQGSAPLFPHRASVLDASLGGPIKRYKHIFIR